jgi:uncharacterized membrane protein YdbT with pleckstrin-like domain
VGFPRKLLTEGEEIQLDLRPHWIALVGPIVVSILAAAALGFLLPKIDGDGTVDKVMRWGLVALAVIVVIVYPVRRIVAWATSQFVVTNERLIHREGLIAKHSLEIPVERINDVRFHQSVFERLIGAGDLMIESAGERGQQRFANVRKPEDVQKRIYEMAEARSLHMESGGRAAAPAPSMTEELARLADLRERGVITEEEFQAQKARLLSGE